MIEIFRIHLENGRYESAAKLYAENAWRYQTLMNHLLEEYAVRDKVINMLYDLPGTGEHHDQI